CPARRTCRIRPPRKTFARSSSPARSPARLRTLAARRSRPRELMFASPSSVCLPVLFKDLEQVFSIAVLGQRVCQSLELFRVNEAHAKRNLLGATHLHALALLDGLNEHRRMQEGFVRAGIKPGESSPKNLD